MITTLLITFFRVYCLNLSCNDIFHSTVFVLFLYINYSLFWKRTLQNLAYFPLECWWGTFICSDTIERPMTSGFMEKLFWNTTIIQSCSTRTPKRMISVVPIELRFFIIFFTTFPKVSPCCPFVVPYFPIWLWQSAKIKCVVADFFDMWDKYLLYSSTGHRSTFVKFLYARTIFLLLRKWSIPYYLSYWYPRYTYRKNSRLNSSHCKDNCEFLSLKPECLCCCPALRANWTPKTQTNVSRRNSAFSLPTKPCSHK